MQKMLRRLLGFGVHTSMLEPLREVYAAQTICAAAQPAADSEGYRTSGSTAGSPVIIIWKLLMFSNAFQSGTHVEVFDSKGTVCNHLVNKEKNEFYAQLYRSAPTNGVKRDFDKQVKGYLLEL